MAKTILITAGGTGGHLFPAEALAHELAPRGYDIHLATDHRATNYGSEFPAKEIHIIASATFGDRSPIGLVKSAGRLATGFVQSLALVRRLRPVAAIGFGGYPTLPPLLAASLLGRPTLIHEANAVMGRANRFLAGRVSAIATSFADTGLMGEGGAKAAVTGNPVRPRCWRRAPAPRSTTENASAPHRHRGLRRRHRRPARTPASAGRRSRAAG